MPRKWLQSRSSQGVPEMGNFLHEAYMSSLRKPQRADSVSSWVVVVLECPGALAAKLPATYLSEAVEAEALGAGAVFFCVAGCRRSPPRVAAGFVGEGEMGGSLPLGGLASW